MSDQHAAAALTAAAAIALVLITRAAVLRSSVKHITRTARPHRPLEPLCCRCRRPAR